MRDITFTPLALEQLQWWMRQDRKVATRVMNLAEAAARDPHAGIGKPEALKRGQPGRWSRRITAEHRLVYTVHDDTIRVLACRNHYDD